MRVKTRLMLDLLHEEVELLKSDEPELDPRILDKLYSSVIVDVRKDEMWGPPIGQSDLDPRDAVRHDWEALPREYRAFVEAGLRALGRLGGTLRAHRHSPA
ncbi:MAG: hypothetical protein FJ317_09190 [SAR202 cluster bacterium]|nr:hypothetical protein [SAR202 cluster bacterium]